MKAAFITAASAALLLSCGERKHSSHNTSGSGKPTIAVVNYPLAYFAERLAGDFAAILFAAPADEDPAFWEPGDEEIAAIQKADLILLNGATYAKWTATTTLPFETTVDTSASFADRFIEVKEAVTHTHGKDDTKHSHGGTAFTTWMDLKQAALQAKAAAEAITDEWPDKKDAVMKNLAALESDLMELDRAMAAATAKLKSAPVLASHPVYQYWERAYGLMVPSLLWEPEMDLDDAAMADLKKLQDANPGAAYFVWEGDPLPSHIEKLKAAGLTSLVVSPCGNRPESGDFLSVMKANLAALEAAAN
jgi:zinc transport system substrate-binding protein